MSEFDLGHSWEDNVDPNAEIEFRIADGAFADVVDFVRNMFHDHPTAITPDNDIIEEELHKLGTHFTEEKMYEAMQKMTGRQIERTMHSLMKKGLVNPFLDTDGEFAWGLSDLGRKAAEEL